MVCWSISASLLGSLLIFQKTFCQRNDRLYAACDIHIPGLPVKQKTSKNG
jgi:hypothetical protein